MAAAGLILVAAAAAQTSGAYKVTNLISDGSVPASVTDPGFINPWAISASGTWWISTAGSGYDYVVASTPNPGTINFKVIVPPASGSSPGMPTGSVTTGGTTGMILPNGTKASFLFSTLDGTISGWNSKLGMANAICEIAINNHAAGAEYTGIAIINTATASYILAANFAGGNAIEVYDSTFKPTKLAGTFTDPNLPAGYAPYSVHVLNNQVYVAYALRSGTAPYHSMDALGNGAVSVFDTSGNFVARIATGGDLDSPWGVAIAPANFGIFGGAILIGNFGNGLINAYDPMSYAYVGQLTDANANPLSYASLWELLPGGTAVGNTTSVSGGNMNTVYFTAGLTNEAHGLFGAISNDASAAGAPTYAVSAATGALTVKNGSSVGTTVSVEPIYGFAGGVELSCSGLPSGSKCTFSPSEIITTGNAPVLSFMTIQTSFSMAQLHQRRLAGIAYGFLLPGGAILFLVLRRSKGTGNLFRVLVLCGVTLAALGVVTSCSSAAITTPMGTSQVVVTAASTGISRSAPISLTVQ